jgi:hypothetical protein
VTGSVSSVDAAHFTVIPAQAGIQRLIVACGEKLDPGLRRDDEVRGRRRDDEVRGRRRDDGVAVCEESPQ